MVTNTGYTGKSNLHSKPFVLSGQMSTWVILYTQRSVHCHEVWMEWENSPSRSWWWRDDCCCSHHDKLSCVSSHLHQCPADQPAAAENNRNWSRKCTNRSARHGPQHMSTDYLHWDHHVKYNQLNLDTLWLKVQIYENETCSSSNSKTLLYSRWDNHLSTLHGDFLRLCGIALGDYCSRACSRTYVA